MTSPDPEQRVVTLPDGSTRPFKIPKKPPGNPVKTDGCCNNPLAKASKVWGMDLFCKRKAGWGTNHSGIGACKMHWGNAPNHQRHAERIIVKQNAEKMLSERLAEGTPVGDPVIELAKIGGEIVAWQEVCREGLDALNSVMDVTDRTGIEHTRAKVEIYERSLQQTFNYLVQLEKLGIAKKTLSLKEEQAQAIAMILLSVVNAPSLGLGDDQREVAISLLLAQLKKHEAALSPQDIPQLEAHYIDAEEVED